MPAAELAGELFAPPPDQRVRSWLATRDGEPVAAAHTEQHLDGVNDATVRLEVATPPAPPGRGLAPPGGGAAAALAEGGATSVYGWPWTTAGEAFCRAWA